ncbi:MAG: hypothetical protein MI717_10610, partial [Spirochaetales bacterium]|nr:hypothetical protein [Spirochaetales bacterium]
MAITTYALEGLALVKVAPNFQEYLSILNPKLHPSRSALIISSMALLAVSTLSNLTFPCPCISEQSTLNTHAWPWDKKLF